MENENIVEKDNAVENVNEVTIQETTDNVVENPQVEPAKLSKKEQLKERLKELLKNKKVIIPVCVVLVLLIAVVLVFLLRKDNSTEEVKPKSFYIENISKQSSGEYVNSNDTFIVETNKGSLEKVKKHLFIEPAVNYDVKQLSKNKYKVEVKDVPADKIINFEYLENKVVEDKWAFQSTKDLTITSIYPENNKSNISTASTIEITFSYPNVDDINKSVTIEPPIEGKFERSGRTWILKPTKPLESNQTYTITVKNDITAGDKKLLEGMKTIFSTYQTSYESKGINYNSITVDNIETFRSNENPMFISKEKISKVSMLQFNSSEEFKKYLLNNPNYKTTSLGELPYHEINSKLYMIDRNFNVGYYLVQAYLESGELYFNMPLQINNLQSYLLATSNDFLVWTSSNNQIQQDVSISYGSKIAKTDKNGLAIIKKYNDKSEKIKYVEVGKDNPVFVGLKNNDTERYPYGYVYTDRPLYKNTDDINIFGYIPLKYYEDENIEKGNFVLSLGDKKIPISITDDGTFTTKYHLDNMTDGTRLIELKYKDKTIATRYVTVEEYQKEMYDFKIDMDKNYVDAGKDFKFSVTVTHISGVKVPNKEIQVIYGDEVINGTTNDKGIATFSIPTSLNDNITTKYHSESITIKNNLTESSQKGYHLSFFVIDRNLTLTNSSYKSGSKKVVGDMYTVSTSSNIKNINWSNTLEALKDKPFNGTAQVELEETEHTQTIKSYNYNEITKENVPVYDYNSNKKIVKQESYSIKDGKIDYKVNYDFKKKGKDVNYSYRLIFTLNDKNNNKTEFSYYLYDEGNSSSSITGYYRYDYNPVANDFYNLYNYYMPIDEKLYAVNEQIIRDLYSYNGEKEVENNKFLFIKYKNGILDTSIVNNTKEISSTFTNKDRAGIRITGAYLKNGNFYRLPTEYLDYDEANSKLDIDLKTNKTAYKPQEEVELNIKVTKNDKGIKSKVNISVVDEGVFKAVEDNTNILGNLYTNLYYSQYTYSTYRDYSLTVSNGGAGGTSGAPRADFGDTIFFKTIDTDNSGNAKVKFKLNDSVTSFRITAHATTDDVDAGSAHTNIESQLPVSISFVKPQGIKEKDDTVLNAVGIGKATGEINYEFYIKEINKKVTAKGEISKNVYANFGKLKAGKYTATITAKSGDYTDKVEFSFDVVKTQTEVSVKNTSSINKKQVIKPTKNPIKLDFYRSTYINYEKYLNILKDTNENRLDTKFTYYKGLEYEAKYSGSESKPELGDISVFKEKKGYKYLPGEEIDETLTAIISYYDPTLAFEKSRYYELIRNNDSSTKLKGYLNLAAQKEPILDDLHQLTDITSGGEMALAYVFLGDYKRARKFYRYTEDQGLKTYLSTFVDKKNAKKLIDKLYNTDKANRYLYFAIISYFENNNAGLSTEEEVTVSYGGKEEKVIIPSLGKRNLLVDQDNLKDLNLKSKYKDIYVDYYYDGLLNEIEKENKIKNIKCNLKTNNIKLGTSTTLTIDITNVPDRTTLYLYLPNGLTLGGGTNNNEGVSIYSNTKEKVGIHIYDKKSNTIFVPLYASSPGEYVIEPIVVKSGEKYQLSNSVKLKISE